MTSQETLNCPQPDPMATLYQAMWQNIYYAQQLMIAEAYKEQMASLQLPVLLPAQRTTIEEKKAAKGRKRAADNRLKPYVCDRPYCGRSFSHEGYLNVHIRNHARDHYGFLGQKWPGPLDTTPCAPRRYVLGREQKTVLSRREQQPVADDWNSYFAQWAAQLHAFGKTSLVELGDKEETVGKETPQRRSCPSRNETKFLEGPLSLPDGDLQIVEEDDESGENVDQSQRTA